MRITFVLFCFFLLCTPAVSQRLTLDNQDSLLIINSDYTDLKKIRKIGRKNKKMIDEILDVYKPRLFTSEFHPNIVEYAVIAKSRKIIILNFECGTRRHFESVIIVKNHNNRNVIYRYYSPYFTDKKTAELIDYFKHIPEYWELIEVYHYYPVGIRRSYRWHLVKPNGP
jgi:hypothetical protein